MIRRSFQYLAFVSLAVAAGCSPKASEAQSGGDDQGTGGSTAAGDAGSSTGGVLLGGGGDLNGGLGGGTQSNTGGGGPLTSDAACKGLSAGAESITTEMPAPVAIYIVLDNSGSMEDCADGSSGGDNNCDNPPSKWDVAVQALSDFVDDPNSAGIDVALQYFHPEGVGNDPNECDGSGHATAAVQVGRLPDNAQALKDSLAAEDPGGDTPTVGALTGGTQFCAAFQAQNPDEQCVVVLVTDGQPNGCGLNGRNDTVDPNSASVLTPIAANGLSNGVTTFTIGMQGVSAAGFDLLDAIARAGGSDCTPGAAGDEACDVSTSGAAGFLDALNAIRETITVTERTTLPCEWEIPAPPDGKQFDPELVNVAFEADVGGSQSIGKVPTRESCDSVAGGWHYDDEADPTRIMVCPQTCDTITAITDARVDVLFGCATEPAIFQ